MRSSLVKLNCNNTSVSALSRRSLRDLLLDGPIIGREDDDDNNDDDDDGDDEDDDDSSTGAPANSDGRDPQVKIQALEDEKNRHYNKRKAAEDENKTLREELEKFKRKDNSDLENAQKDVESLTKDNTSLKGLVQKLALDNAFLTVNDVKWHNPATALRLIDLSDVEIDEEGKVDDKALKAAIKKLADENPYLVAQSDSANDDDEDDADVPSGPRERTGNPSSGSTKKRDKDKLRREKLLREYPALRQHVHS